MRCPRGTPVPWWVAGRSMDGKLRGTSASTHIPSAAGSGDTLHDPPFEPRKRRGHRCGHRRCGLCASPAIPRIRGRAGRPRRPGRSMFVRQRRPHRDFAGHSEVGVGPDAQGPGDAARPAPSTQDEPRLRPAQSRLVHAFREGRRSRRGRPHHRCPACPALARRRGHRSNGGVRRRDGRHPDRRRALRLPGSGPGGGGARVRWPRAIGAAPPLGT